MFVPQHMYIPQYMLKQVPTNLNYHKVLTETMYLPKFWIRSQVLLTL